MNHNFPIDSLADGRTFRIFNIPDDFYGRRSASRSTQARSEPGIIRVLDQIASWRGYPKQIRMDNGPEFISLAMEEWTESYQIHLEFIKPGKPPRIPS